MRPERTLIFALVSTFFACTASSSPETENGGKRDDLGSSGLSFEFDFTEGTSAHGFVALFRDIPEEIHLEYLRRRDAGLDLGPVAIVEAPGFEPADRTHWLLNSGLFEVPDGIGGFGLLVQGNNHSDDMDMYIAREFSADDGIAPNTTYEVTFERYTFASDAPALAFGAGGSPDLNLSGAVTALDPFEYVLDDIPEQPHARHRPGLFEAGEIGLGTTAVCIQPGSPVSFPGLEECPTSGRIHFEVNEVIKSPSTKRTLQVTSDADGRFWVMIGGHSGFEAFSAYFHRTLSLRVDELSPQN
jgi:hypothetical protein